MIVPKYIIDQNSINKEIREISITLNEQRQLKHILLLYLEKLSSNINTMTNSNDLKNLSTYIQKVEKSFETIKENINKLLELKSSLEQLSLNKDNSSFDWKKYNQDYNDLKLKISSNNQLYFSIMESILNFMQLNLSETVIEKSPIENSPVSYSDNLEIITDTNTPTIRNIQTENLNCENTSNNNNNNNDDDNDVIIPKNNEATLSQENIEPLKERILTISESDEIVILPYSQNELEEFFSNNPEKYSSIQDIIDKEYTYSLKKYKNTSSTRFKKIFNLAKKSNLSYFSSLNFAIKLFSNSHLHPATISACRNTNELENYVECLSNNNLNNFKCFKIIYT